MIFTLAGVVIALLVVALIVYLLLRWFEKRHWFYSKASDHAQPDSTD